MTDPLKPHARAIGLCTWCPKLCRFCCPTAEVEHRETVTPWFKMTAAGLVRLGHPDPGSEMGELFLHCLGCLHCRVHCKHENDVPAALFAARAVSLQAGGEAPALAAMLDRFRDTGNPWGEALGPALRAAVPERFFVPEAQAQVFAGCQAIRAGQRHLAPLFALLDVLGVEHVGVFEQAELCCGAPLWQAGDQRGFLDHGRALAARLTGVRQLICPCPTCAHVLGGVLAANGVRLAAKIVSLDAFLAPLVRARPPERKLPGRHTFHDPCHLARHLERTGPVRDLLAAVLAEPLCESPWSGQDTVCCGGGGLVPHSLPGLAAGAAEARMAQLRATGAEQVVSACPGCVRQLGGAQAGLPVLDLVEVLLAGYSH